MLRRLDLLMKCTKILYVPYNFAMRLLIDQFTQISKYLIKEIHTDDPYYHKMAYDQRIFT